jgi:hypothetical protein
MIWEAKESQTPKAAKAPTLKIYNTDVAITNIRSIVKMTLIVFFLFA